MSQPVIDTLKLCDALRNTGMEREQAEGVARARGGELGAHVAVQSDLQSGFQGVRTDLGAEIQGVRTDLGAEIQKVRTDLGSKIQAVDAKVDVLRAELTGGLDGRMDGLDGRMDGLGGRMDALDRKIDAVNGKLTFTFAGLGLLLSVLTVASGMGVFQPAPSMPAAPSAPLPAQP